MKLENNYKAEDLLSGTIPEKDNHLASDEQQQLAANIRSIAASSGNDTFLAEEKDLLWQRIGQNIPQKSSSWKHSIWLKIAASIIVILSTGLWLLNRTADMGDQMELAANKIGIDSAAETKLILSAHQSLTLKGKESRLSYQKNGNIRINSQLGSIQQSTSGHEQLFNILLVPYGKRSELTLIDGTKVWLNSGSKLVYPVSFSNEKRVVFLEGEAYFEVQHDLKRPFYVQTKNTEIRVLGTKFNVNAYLDDRKNYTVLAEGSIELTANRKASNIVKKRLVPGNLLVWDQENAALQLSTVDVEEYISWKDGYVILKKAPLADIFKKMQRFYKIDIILKKPHSGNETFSGRLDLKQDVEEVMDIICETSSLKYKQEKGRIIID